MITTTIDVRDIRLRGLYRHSTVEVSDSGIIYPGVPERITWTQRDDTVLYRTAESEYLFDIVVGFYKVFYAQPLFVVEIVAQFQPRPIIDVSVPLPANYELQLPSTDFIESVALSDADVWLPEM